MKNSRTKRFVERYGPWALVTGASSGIGRALAVELGTRQLNLVLVARRTNELETLARELAAAHGIETRVIPADLSAPSGLEAVTGQTADLDIGLLAAAAGFGTAGTFLAANLEDEREMLDVNCKAVLELSHAFGRRLAQRGSGGMILFASLVGYQGTPHAAHYAATKAYVQSLAEALHIELAPLGVDVLCSAPGPVRTGFATRARMTMGAAETPETVARATLQVLGKRMTVTPGPLSKLLTWSLIPVPRSLRVRLMGAIMGGMTKHLP